jgi:ATP-dependent RNA helicase RhlB
MIRKLFGKKKQTEKRGGGPDHSAREQRQKIEIVSSDAKRGSEPRASSPPVVSREGSGKSERKPKNDARSGSASRSEPRRKDSRDNRGTRGDSGKSRRGDGGRGRSQRSRSERPPQTTSKRVYAAPRTVPPLPELLPPAPEDGKKRFCDFELEKEVLAACQDAGFKYCTPIQAKSLPTTLRGLDLTGKAQTGTGKTAAFLISSINHFLKNPLAPEKRLPGSCRMLVLAPTRELAIQIHKDAEVLCKYTELRNLVVFGGMDHTKQRDALSQPVDILVGTPGRIIDYSRSGDLKLGKAEILVIDEADRMLDMGFIPDVRRIVAKLPSAGNRQTMFYSATFDQKILRLVSSWLKDPVNVESEPENIVSGLIDQTFFTVTTRDKMTLLKWILANDSVSRMLVFVNRKDLSQRLQSRLRNAGVDCGVLSGDVPQNKRIRILENFRSGKLKVIVATDVAARGIHVDDVSHVINYDLPYEPGDYVHRVGRTGRAGNKGKSISFLCEKGSFVMPDIEEILGHEIKCVVPTPEMLGEKREE